MSVQLCRSIETITGERVTATIFVGMTGKSARIEVWSNEPRRRRLDTRRCSPTRAQDRARELVEFWNADQPTENDRTT